MSTTLLNSTPSLRRLLMISAVACLTMTATGCRTFQESRFTRTVVLGRHDPLPTEPVQPGYTFRSLDSIASGDMVVVSIQDSLPVPLIITAEYDRKRTTDTSLALNNVRDPDVPKTLSVAFRNVQQVYPVDRYPSYVKTDTGLTLVWVLLGLPAFAIAGSTLLALLSVALFGEPTWSSNSDEGNTMSVFSMIGAAAGIVTWVALTIPIR